MHLPDYRSLRGFIFGCALLTALLTLSPAYAQETAVPGSSYSPPAWAFPSLYSDEPAAVPAEPGRTAQPTPLRVPGSSLVLSHLDPFSAPDWHPDDHPAMPDIVKSGRQPVIQACAFCHLPNGHGGPHNGSLAELPEAYIMRQISDFKNGLRRDLSRNGVMETISRALRWEESRAAAQYYSKLKRQQWTRVVESETVPRTHVSDGHLVRSDGTETEALGTRIIEIPENSQLTELHDSRSGYLAYVPPGSIKRGESLVMTGGQGAKRGRTVACIACHGKDLRGDKDVPALAGMSPVQTARQLYNMKIGLRREADIVPMKKVVENLTEEDLVEIGAYLASLKP